VLHFGDTHTVNSTRQRRIRVATDDELATALERVQSHFPEQRVSDMVRDLAIRGAAALEAETEWRSKM
jgi:hypothetical protein